MPEHQHHLPIEAANHWIRGRRTWKPENMDPQREVPQALLDAMFENANWAPTHGLTEPWRFRVYRGDARVRLAADCRNSTADHTPPGGFRPDKHAKLGRTPLQAPVVILICMHRQTGGKDPGDRGGRRGSLRGAEHASHRFRGRPRCQVVIAADLLRSGDERVSRPRCGGPLPRAVLRRLAEAGSGDAAVAAAAGI